MRLSNLLLAHALLISAGCAFYAPCARAASDGDVVERKAYAFPSYERAMETTDVERYADKAAYEAAVGDAKFEFEKLKYLSGGLKVVAYVYRPKQTGSRKLPAVIFNRGSSVRRDIAPELVAFFHGLASEGFVIIAPMLRQSDGSEGRDEMGGADLDDLMNVLPLAKSLAYVDANNLFMYGESRGGMMTYLAIKKGFPVKAAAVFGALTDLRELVDSHPKQYPPAALKQIWADYDERRDEIFKSRSAVFWAESLNAPLLIMHGGADWSVNPEHSLNLAQRLQKLGRVYELVVYAGDNHILSNNKGDRDRRAAGWFKRHLKKQ